MSYNVFCNAVVIELKQMSQVSFYKCLSMRTVRRFNENKREHWSPRMSHTWTIFDECIVFMWNLIDANGL